MFQKQCNKIKRNTFRNSAVSFQLIKKLNALHFFLTVPVIYNLSRKINHNNSSLSPYKFNGSHSKQITEISVLFQFLGIFNRYSNVSVANSNIYFEIFL